jgi:acetyl esterase/lipase
MQRSVTLIAGLAFLALTGTFMSQAPQAEASRPLLPILAPKPAPPPVVPPVQPPLSVDPAGPVRGTMILVYGSGWRGHSGDAARQLLTERGDVFLARGWRVVSIDYEEGTAGLQSVLDAAGGELARGSGNGPVCVYGESSGAHLALMAATRLSAIDCVIGVGTPTDLQLYVDEAAGTSDGRVTLVSGQITRLFGTTAATTAPWDLVSLAPAMHADVLLVHEDDDVMVSLGHSQRFKAARPTTQLIELPAGDKGDPVMRFAHGTTSTAGRAYFGSAAGAFADRAIANERAERTARTSGCSNVSRPVSEIGANGLRGTLGCMARKFARTLPAGSQRWRKTSVVLHGKVDAARLWARLTTSKSGRLALVASGRRRAKITVKPGDPSRVILRALAR